MHYPDIPNLEKRECRLHGKQRRSFENWVKHYLLQDELLYKSIQIEKEEQPITVLVVPTEMRMPIMQSFHDASGHCSHTKTWSQLQKRFYWEGCHIEVKSYCWACQFCFKRKRVADAKAGLSLSLTTTTRSNQIVSIDYVGPVTETSSFSRSWITIRVL